MTKVKVVKHRVIHHVKVVTHTTKKVVTHRITLTCFVWVVAVKCALVFRDQDIIFAAIGGIFQDEIARFSERRKGGGD